MYIRLTNGNVDTYHYSVGQLRRDNPQTSFPKRIPDEMLGEWGVYPVTSLEVPSHDERSQRVERNAQPHQENGGWFIGWSVVDKATEEIQQYDNNAATSVRSQRDALLASTDWLVIKAQETGTNVSPEWVTYRQALRDITAQEGFPHSVTWPAKPQ